MPSATYADTRRRPITTFEPNDLQRMKRLKIILKSKTSGAYERVENNDHSNFMEDLKAHGRRISVAPDPAHCRRLALGGSKGRRCARRSSGSRNRPGLLPRHHQALCPREGTGPSSWSLIAPGRPKRPSNSYERAAIGTGWSVAADDPQSDPCSMMLAVTKVDEVAAEERLNRQVPDGSPRPPEAACFRRTRR